MDAAAKLKSARNTRALRRPPPVRNAARARENAVAEQFDRLADSVLLTEPETARVVGYSPNTLKFWRVQGKNKGPPAIRMPGTVSVRYRVGAVRAWLSGIDRNDG
jgi:hypothetical protein